MGQAISSTKQVLTIVSLFVCLFFSALKSAEIIDGIEHSGRAGVAHSHSALSLASMDVDHDAHEVDTPQDHGSVSSDADSSPDGAAHHHHHHDTGSDALATAGPSAGKAPAYAMANRRIDRPFHAFGPSDGLKRPPRDITLHV